MSSRKKTNTKVNQAPVREVKPTVSAETIRKECKAKIDKYEKLHYRDINLSIIPEGLTLEDAHKVINIMIRKDYTFLAAYYVYKHKHANMIHVKDIVRNDKFNDRKPSEKKIKAKIDGLKLGIINTITIDRSGRIIDGIASLIAMRRNKENYVPYIQTDKIKVYGKDNRHPVHGRMKVREDLFNKQNGKCYICKRQMTLDLNEPDWRIHATVDHMIPLSKGGSNELSNCALSCSLCNQLKADSLLTPELKRYIAEQSKLAFESNKVIIEKKSKVEETGV